MASQLYRRIRWTDEPSPSRSHTEKFARLRYVDEFDARIFQHPVSGEYAVVFRGTDDLPDMLDNLGQFNGEVSDQYRAAADLAIKVIQENPGETFTFAGHSLGGGLATTAALATSRQATVFNAAALHPNSAAALGIDMRPASTLNDHVIVDGEIVTSIQDASYPSPSRVFIPDHDAHLYPRDVESNPAPSSRFLIPQPRPAWMDQQQAGLSFFMRPEIIVRHLMATVIESITTLLEVACGIPR